MSQRRYRMFAIASAVLATLQVAHALLTNVEKSKHRPTARRPDGIRNNPGSSLPALMLTIALIIAIVTAAIAPAMSATASLSAAPASALVGTPITFSATI